MLDTKSSNKCILILKTINDPRLRYMTAKKLTDLWPETPFMEWKGKLDALETVVLARSESHAELGKFKKELDKLAAPAEIVDQKNIGGKPVF